MRSGSSSLRADRCRWVAAALTCFAFLAGACTPEGHREPTPNSPAVGGKVEIGIVGEPATLDPYDEDASFLTYALVRPVFPTIFVSSPDGTFEPDLARTLEARGEAIQLTLAKRRWSNGRAITARDVAASIERATAPSGFAKVSSFKVLSRHVIELRGRVDDWEAVLARGTFVLPHGRLTGGNVSGGPFKFTSYRRGRSLTYKANAGAPDPPTLESLSVSFVQSSDLLLRLLDEGKVDAAWLPSMVNLGERLDELDVTYDSAVGDERISLLANRGRVEPEVGEAVIRTLDVRNLIDSFVRDEGSAGRIPVGSPGPVPTLLSVAVPEGDELLAQMQRAIQIDLDRAGVTAELITGPVSTFYGEWQRSAPADLSLMRSFVDPGPAAIVLASVASFVAWREKVHGIAVNPSLEGPLWNARDWWIDPSI